VLTNETVDVIDAKTLIVRIFLEIHKRKAYPPPSPTEHHILDVLFVLVRKGTGTAGISNSQVSAEAPRGAPDRTLFPRYFTSCPSARSSS
jgi:hypothetical protein